MLTLISPAKTLDFQSPLLTQTHTLPIFLNDAARLIKDCKKLTIAEIAKLMSISPKLAEQNYDRFQHWHANFDLHNARQAILVFKGDVYKGLDVDDFNDDDLQFAQNHLRILSGLYGLLRPLDLIQPYRLEMGIRLKNGNNSNLYQFWDNRLTDELNQALNSSSAQHKIANVLINLASNEYFKAIVPTHLDATIIHPQFLDNSKGEYKVISFYAKKARGLMSRFIIKNKITHYDDIKAFDLEGYQYDPKRSTEFEWYFIRDHKVIK
ncbi:peroxide stress protein YaaA [Orbaceae bacterium ESL0727]|nr:peroxide stress protein YaaA [Orbaceae bacterium ESL0727]